MFPPINPYMERRRAELEQQELERRLALEAIRDCDGQGLAARLFSWVAVFSHSLTPRHERPHTRSTTDCLPRVVANSR